MPSQMERSYPVDQTTTEGTIILKSAAREAQNLSQIAVRGVPLDPQSQQGQPCSRTPKPI